MYKLLLSQAIRKYLDDLRVEVEQLEVGVKKERLFFLNSTLEELLDCQIAITEQFFLMSSLSPRCQFQPVEKQTDSTSLLNWACIGPLSF